MSLVAVNKVTYEIMLEGQVVDVALIGLSVQTAVNKIPRARIEMHYRSVSQTENVPVNFQFEKASSFGSIPAQQNNHFLPGKKVQINLANTKEEVREVFSGYIVKQTVEAKNNGTLLLCIDCKHEANLLTLQKRTRVLQHVGTTSSTASDQSTIETVDEISVLKKVVEQGSDGNINLEIEGLGTTKVDHENMVQYNCSDWDFLVMRAEVLGYVCVVQNKTITLLKPVVQAQGSTQLELGENLFSYEAEHDETHRREKTTFSNWNPEDEDQKTSEKSNTDVNQETSKIQQNKYLSYNGDLDEKEIDSYLENDLKRQELGKIRGLAKIAGTAKIEVIDTVQISGFGSVWDRDTLVSGIKHIFRSGVWYTYVQCGLSNHSHAELYHLNGSTNNTIIPNASGLIYGKMAGYIKGTDGQELAQVIITAADEKKDSRIIYARLSTLSAGANGGVIFRPFEGDEVVLGFIDNDPRFPVILGALYNNSNPPIFPLKDDGGSELIQNEIGFSFFKDWTIHVNEEDKNFTLSSPNGQSIELSEESGSEKMTLSFDSSNSITINAEGIEIVGKAIAIKSDQGDVTIEGMNTEMKAQVKASIAGTQVESKGDALNEISGGSTLVNS